MPARLGEVKAEAAVTEGEVTEADGADVEEAQPTCIEGKKVKGGQRRSRYWIAGTWEQ